MTAERQIPGANSTELLKRREAAVPRAVFNTVPIFVDGGEGPGRDFCDTEEKRACENHSHDN